MSNRGYECEISFMEEEMTDIIEKVKCVMNCNRCIKAQENSSNEDVAVPSSSDNPTSDSDESTEDNSKILNYKTIKGKFFMISCANLSCACDRSPNGFSPYAHLGDGCIDLVFVQHSSFINNVRLLLRMSGKNKTIVSRYLLGKYIMYNKCIEFLLYNFFLCFIYSFQTSLPFVNLYRTKQFYFKNLNQTIGLSTPSLSDSTQPFPFYSSESSNWNCDGEVLHENEVNVRSHCQLVQVFRRGLIDDSIPCDKKKCCCF